MSESYKSSESIGGAATLAEVIPSVSGGVSGIASATAPFLVVDVVGGRGVCGGMVHFGLEATRFMGVDGECRTDRVVVAHLRMTLGGLQSLKEAIAEVELLAQSGPNARN